VHFIRLDNPMGQLEIKLQGCRTSALRNLCTKPAIRFPQAATSLLMHLSTMCGDMMR
jgi:hypothetical protein